MITFGFLNTYIYMQKGNDQINEWINTYTDELLSWAMHKISDSESAKDIVQDTFLAVAKNHNQFKKESNPKTWIFSILNNKISDYYRKKYRQEFSRIIAGSKKNRE